MFIRTKDNVKISDKNYETFTFLNTTRKGNTALKFEIINNDIRFFADEFNARMIPKDKTYILQDKEIKILTTEDGLSIIYQDFDEDPCNFLTLEDDDEIKLIDFYDIIPDQTEIFCLDSKSEGYYYSKVAYTSVIGHIVVDMDIELDKKSIESNKVFTNEFNTLSRYIIGSNPKEGIILNGIMII